MAAAALRPLSRSLAMAMKTNIIRPRTSSSSRCYGASAAQLQYDDDYDYDVEFDDDRTARVRPMIDGEGSEPRRGVQWVIIGEPGAKKHVFAEGLSKLLEVPHISLHSLARQELHPHSSLYKQIENAVNQGKLVPEDIIFSLLSKKLEEGYFRGQTGFILDGIPRTRMQASCTCIHQVEMKTPKCGVDRVV